MPDDPFRFVTRCVLQRHLGWAWTVGLPSRPRAAVVVAPWNPREPFAFGPSIEEAWELLRRLSGWDCVNLATEDALRLRPVLERGLGVPVRLYGDLYFVLDEPARVFDQPAVRRLTEDDLDLVERAPPPLRLEGYDSPLAALAGGVAAGAIVDGELVGLAQMPASSSEHGDVGAHTLEPWRNRGFASAASSLVARELQSRGLRPVWSTGEDNERSKRVAEKVGFREFGRQEYLVIPSLQASGGFRPLR